jgi:TIR domain
MEQEFAYDVFLSHSSKDKLAVRALAQRLQADGVRVWFDENNIAIGEHIGVALEQGLQASRHIVLIMSPHSFASDWVTAERWSTLLRDPLNKNLRYRTLLLSSFAVCS